MDHAAALKARIEDVLSHKGRALVAIDGMAASGKTTLASALCAQIPASAAVHMDDFTVPFEDRYPGYFQDTLSNADLARFAREVLAPFERGEAVCYRPYVCHPAPGFLAPVVLAPDTRVLLIEGAYCLHPDLFDRYDLRVLHTVSPETQRARILARSGPAQLERFEALWIPMENRHIAVHGLRAACDLLLHTP